MAHAAIAPVSVSPSAGPAAIVPLFSYSDLYQRAATMSDVQARQVAGSLNLAKAVQDALLASVMGSSSSAQQISQNAVTMDAGIRNHVLSHVDDPDIKKEMIESISRYVESFVNKTITEITDRIDSDIQPNKLDNTTNNFTTLNQEMEKVLGEIESDRVNRIATGGKTARAQRELRAMDAQRVFREEGKELTPFLTARTKLVKALQLNQMAGIIDLADDKIDVDALVDGSDDKREKAISSKLVAVDKAITQIYIVNLGAFGDGKGNGINSISNSKELIVPNHLEKGKAEEFGSNLCLFTRNNLDRFFVIHRYIKRIVNEMGDGTFWKPPIKSKNYEGVLAHEKNDYIKQSAELYGELKKKVHKDIFDTLTSPKPSGFYGELNVWTEVDDGVLTVYVLMMRFFPNDNSYCNKLKTFMTNTPLLVHNTGANVRRVCDEITPPLKEIMKLGIRIPWSTSGLAFIEALTTAKPRFTPYLHPLRHDVADPEDSAHNFQFLIARVENALNDIKSPNIPNSPELLAYESQYVEDGGDDTHHVTYTEGGSDEGWEIVPYTLEAHETQYSYGSEEFHDAQEYPTDCADHQWDNGAYHDASEGEIPIFQSNIDYHAHLTTKGGKGKFGGYGNGKGKYGTQKGKPKGGKGKYGGNPYNPRGQYNNYRPYGSPKGGVNGPIRDPTRNPFEANEASGTRICSAKDCQAISNAAFMFCYNCHQKGKEQGFLMDKSSRRIPINHSKSSGNDTPSPKSKRAYEAFLETLSEEQRGMLQEGELLPHLNANATTMEGGNADDSLIKRVKYGCQ
jgi:hypothetical protein